MDNEETPLRESRPCTCGRTPMVHRLLDGAITIHCACGLHLLITPAPPPGEQGKGGGEGREGEFNPASLDHAEMVRLARLGFYGNTSCIQTWRDEGHAAAMRGEPAAFWCGERGHSLFCPQWYLAAPTQPAEHPASGGEE